MSTIDLDAAWTLFLSQLSFHAPCFYSRTYKSYVTQAATDPAWRLWASLKLIQRMCDLIQDYPKSAKSVRVGLSQIVLLILNELKIDYENNLTTALEAQIEEIVNHARLADNETKVPAQILLTRWVRESLMCEYLNIPQNYKFPIQITHLKAWECDALSVAVNALLTAGINHHQVKWQRSLSLVDRMHAEDPMDLKYHARFGTYP